MSNLAYKNYNYLIIAGTSKAATSSVFEYLSHHPQICASNIKETRFFLDTDYPLPVKISFNEGIHKYNDFFECHNVEQIRFEATPDYLYSNNTAFKINNNLPNVKLIFILREPISRLVSWYKYAIQIGQLPKQMNFDEYIKFQFMNLQNSKNLYKHPCFFAFKQGKYSVYLKPFLNLFKREQIHICFYEDFMENPKLILKAICEFSGIDSDYFNDYKFEIFNRSFIVRSQKLHYLYNKYLDYIRSYTYDKPLVRRSLSKVRLFVEPFYLILNEKKSIGLKISDSTVDILKNYYANEFVDLNNMLGVKPPWSKN